MASYKYSSLNNFLYLMKVGVDGQVNETVTLPDPHKAKEKGIFLDYYYINFDGKYYTTWFIDDDTIQKPLEIIKDTKKWSTKEKKAFLTKIKNEANYYYFNNIDKDENYNWSLKEYPSEGNYKIVFLSNGKWQLAELYCTKEDFATMEQGRVTHLPLKETLTTRFSNPPIYKTPKHIKPVYVLKNRDYDLSNKKTNNTNPEFDNTQEVLVFFDINCLNHTYYLKTSYLMPKNYKKFLNTPSAFLRNENEEMETFCNETIYTREDLAYCLYFSDDQVYIISFF